MAHAAGIRCLFDSLSDRNTETAGFSRFLRWSCEPIAELDQEEPAAEQEAVAKFVKKRQPSKKVKTKTGKKREKQVIPPLPQRV
ncbi:hypothetical protein ANANG_G00012510 [Anguilla anguilla]|uniref:Uncharacterized protein n=1 Tax=Anguilla anguilla TaxID=7936 RepID=A0A9D3SBD3_ANGAN|nr:hypothetical protein ANANG_G00012510 [Anguilla anguilla]